MMQNALTNITLSDANVQMNGKENYAKMKLILLQDVEIYHVLTEEHV